MRDLRPALTRRGFLIGLAALYPALSGCGGGVSDSASSTRTAATMPDEGERHEATWMAWPSLTALYGGPAAMSAVRGDIARIAWSVSEFEPVRMVANRSDAQDARNVLGSDIDVVEMPVDDLWMRDSGPCFVRSEDGSLAARGLNFNGWGERQRHGRDAGVAARVASEAGVPFELAGLTGEGGGLDVDGAGTLLAAESSWVNPNRNPGMTRDEIESALTDALGVDHFLWVPGLAGRDITDYHIDSVARFVAPGEILVELAPKGSPPDVWSRAALTTADALREAPASTGDDLVIHTLRRPTTVRAPSPAFVDSYSNFYLVNDGLIAPHFGDKAADEAAAASLESLFPGRRVVQIGIDTVAAFGGGIHCATQQQPVRAS